MVLDIKILVEQAPPSDKPEIKFGVSVDKESYIATVDTSKIENYIGDSFDFMRNDFAIEYYRTSIEHEYNIVLKQNVESVVEMSYPDNNINQCYSTYPWLFTSKIFKSENSLPMVNKTGQLFYMNYKANDETLLPDLTKRISIYDSDGLTIKTRKTIGIQTIIYDFIRNIWFQWFRCFLVQSK